VKLGPLKEPPCPTVRNTKIGSKIERTTRRMERTNKGRRGGSVVDVGTAAFGLGRFLRQKRLDDLPKLVAH
jgi:lipopolysaccharide/colanic/teichoic acid biosynthesis glycosyltransferase